MQTLIKPEILNTDAGREADRILRSCVHCGFCTATCPTYQMLGDELDGPRGRIYQIKTVLEGMPPTRELQMHLDRCLTCLSCETTCPSGVNYHRLLDIGRDVVQKQVGRPWRERFMRWTLRLIVPYANRVVFLVTPARWIRPLLPSGIAKKIPPRQSVPKRPQTQHTRKVVLFEGCAQSALTPRTNAVTAAVLDRMGISSVVVAQAGCCGALSHHMGAEQQALDFMRANVDALWPQLEQGAEAVVSTASGCGVLLKEYGYLLRHDAAYAQKAEKLAACTKDLSEVLSEADMALFKPAQATRVAFHAPCTLQHGQKSKGRVEALLQAAGYTLTPVQDAHLCCGSAGTYSVLQPELSSRLLQNKLASLQAPQPECIATANVGCQLHLQTQAEIPVMHWVELLYAEMQKQQTGVSA